MTSGRSCVLLIGVAIALGTAGAASAQSSSATRSTSGQSSKAGTVSKSAGQGPTKTASPVSPQGFSIVLVLADLQSGAAQDDVPPAARRALADMKDFLPYKSYKLLDAAWILGHAGSGLHPGGPGTITLRGVDDHEYEVRLTASTSPAAPGRISVRFSLGDAESAVVSHLRSGGAPQAELAALREEIARRQTELASTKREKNASETNVRELERRLVELQRQMERAAEVQAREASPSPRATNVPFKHAPPSRAIIDTSFAMDVGETVVVGASRLKGNSKALIALLTAVPARSPGK